MLYFGPVANADHPGNNSPWFDFLIGFGVLALTWIRFPRSQRNRAALMAALGITAICAVSSPPTSANSSDKPQQTCLPEMPNKISRVDVP